MTNMAWRLPDEDRWIENVTNRSLKNAPAQLVLASDITISNSDSRDPAQKNFISVYGGYYMAHGTTHRDAVGDDVDQQRLDWR